MRTTEKPFDENFEKEFNAMIVETFHLILKEEMQFINSISEHNISSREIHLIQGVGENDGNATITQMAAALHITLASTTVLANRLESEGYITKSKNQSDGREVLLSLTEKGRTLDKMHSEWHASLVKRITSGMSSFEKEVIYSGVKKLNKIFVKDLLD